MPGLGSLGRKAAKDYSTGLKVWTMEIYRMLEWSGGRVEDGKPAQALSSLAKVSEGRDDGRRVFKKQRAKEAFLGKA
jgi:hypothetical protein